MATTTWRRAIGLVAGLNAVGAVGGAVALMSGLMDVGELTDRLPFGSARLGGVALAILVAVPQTVLTVLAARRSPTLAAASMVVGAALVGWILVEVAFLRVVAGLQVAYVLVGLLQVVLGLVLARREAAGSAVRPTRA